MILPELNPVVIVELLKAPYALTVRNQLGISLNCTLYSLKFIVISVGI